MRVLAFSLVICSLTLPGLADGVKAVERRAATAKPGPEVEAETVLSWRASEGETMHFSAPSVLEKDLLSDLFVEPTEYESSKPAGATRRFGVGTASLSRGYSLHIGKGTPAFALPHSGLVFSEPSAPTPRIDRAGGPEPLQIPRGLVVAAFTLSVLWRLLASHAAAHVAMLEDGEADGDEEVGDGAQAQAA